MAGQLCNKNLHPAPEEGKRCLLCQRQDSFRRSAETRGYGLCGNNHGQTPGNVTTSGHCSECVRLGWVPGVSEDDIPPASTWLDWALVHQAMNGKPLVRPLTKREVLCLLTTLRERNPEMENHVLAAEWMNDCTHLVGIYSHYLHYLHREWAANRGPRQFRRLVMTVDQAMHAELDGTIDETVTPQQKTA